MATPEHEITESPTGARPDAPAAAPAHGPSAVPRRRAAVHYAVEGDLRYLSHHDELRLLTRALIRARWPLAWSEGFNPQPRVNVVLPRRVGTASDCQLAIVDLAAPDSDEALRSRIAAALPAGCRVSAVDGSIGAGTPHATSAIYAVELDDAEAGAAAAAIADLLARTSLEIMRDSGPDRPARGIDIRRFVETVWMEGSLLKMRLVFDGQLSARPSEVTTCMGLAPERTEHRVRRVEVRWDKEWTAAPQSAGVRERTTLGQEEDDHARNDSARPAENRGEERN